MWINILFRLLFSNKSFDIIPFKSSSVYISGISSFTSFSTFFTSSVNPTDDCTLRNLTKVFNWNVAIILFASSFLALMVNNGIIVVNKSVQNMSAVQF